MTEPIIQVSDLSKRYHIGVRERYMTFRQALVDVIATPIKRLRNFGRSSHREADTVWALKDISFNVAPGEVVGFIGRNGAGKSTLLKVLSRVTEPTTGRATLRGRVGSLLEVGTGFHPELTGRENVFLSGAILGMSRREIKQRFNEIVDFAGVETFIDTPVKRYSNGMRVRLGFAVAAHLEPEIMMIDEVLAVGDAAFQAKCLGKMNDVSRAGRTVLFVSHNMSAISRLCNRACVLDAGRLVYDGDCQGAVQRYLGMIADTRTARLDLRDHRGRKAGMKPIITSLALRGEEAGGDEQADRNVFRTGEDLVIELGYDTAGEAFNHIFVGIHSALGERICSVGTHLDPHFNQTLHGRGRVQCSIPSLPFAAGDYSLTVAMGNKMAGNADCVVDAIRFRVELDDYFGTGEGLRHGQGHIAQRCRFRQIGPQERSQEDLSASSCVHHHSS